MTGLEERRPADDAVWVDSVRWRFDVGRLALWGCPIVAVLAKLTLAGLVVFVGDDTRGSSDDDDRVFGTGESGLDGGCTTTHVLSCSILDFLVAWEYSSSSSAAVEEVGISVQLLSPNS